MLPRASGPELTYRGLEWCDLCGRRLAAAEILSGMHSACLASLNTPRRRQAEAKRATKIKEA